MEGAGCGDWAHTVLNTTNNIRTMRIVEVEGKLYMSNLRIG
jgi:hypothetical protein